ncbi:MULTISPECIES: DUF2608 domain-containing protein [unclassified Rickettsia]|uniref:DUF2608 domain-containing protein n=1 Tax=unclassified Rickettsia TaxID=114295 RepID=UPI00209FAD83|nr:DUF2608 domain-containing protein [Rickettsia endosymbiont of Ceutorhynchus assimilis]
MLFLKLKLFIKKYFIALILFGTGIATAEIIEVDSLDKINQDFEEIYNKDYLPQDMLVVIGLDKLIFKSLLPSASALGQEGYSKLLPIFKKIKPQSKQVYIDQLLLVDYKQELADTALPNFIKIISNNNIAIIAVSKNFTGNFNNIPTLEIWLADYLKKNFDIDFSRSFSQSNYIIFNNLRSFDNTYPVFYKGILSSNNTPQAELILNFLIEVKFMPKILIAISSDEELLGSMQAQLSSYNSNIAYTGYHYVTADQENDNEKNLAYYTKFFNNLVNKVNKVQRTNSPTKTNKQNNKNPYDGTLN